MTRSRTLLAPDLVADDRGRTAVPFDPFAERLQRRVDRADAETLQRLAAEIGPGIDRWPRIAFYVGVAGIALAFGIIAVQAGTSLVQTGALPWAGLAARWPVYLGVTAGLWLQWAVARRARSGRVRAVMLRHRRCPHCAYDLRSLPPNPDDGATVCPECGGAWRLDDHGQ